ncbi:Outer membrane protein Omp85 [Salinivirga cyanobacteriivorans]|uniref:Outer membrane protein assembly factor BamA n=1 Tax=Salinivirga cyanobacteriivorans TaxID=1307839 RepID=A0A0S2I2Z9_9BACT|nr:outer membrane protein assembly factor BamA [Salinivirga cyanobacteriivorans]ALO16571.1 Outer membrane protein Omp85 [Salinivirga cyanobacteriivorans]
MRRISLLLVIFSFISLSGLTQVSLNNTLNNLDYNNPREFEIGGVTVSGVKFLDHGVLVSLSGLQVGETIEVPGEKISKAIKNLWEQGLFSDVEVKATKIIGNKIFLDIYLQERPRLSAFYFKGIRKSQASDIKEKLTLVRGTQVTKSKIQRAVNTISNYFVDKGYLDANVEVIQKQDTALNNHVVLGFDIDKNERVKIASINFHGNETFRDGQLRRKMKDTKQKTWYNIFKRSKYIEAIYEKDKKKIIDFYNENGYRDAKITRDSIYRNEDSLVVIDIFIQEGNKYYFRDIDWVGNTKYSNEQLSIVLGIKKGDVYDETILQKRLRGAQDAVSTLYLDNGYLFFNVTPVEVNIEGDSIDLEMRVYEGKQARINRVTVVGNTKTHDHVIRRELRTKPGELFSQTDVQRSIRELATLGYFNPEKLNVNPQPNPADGTVDLEYIVEERPSDQIELSGGYGAGMFIGTLGLRLTNLAIGDFFKKGAWRPLPTGDGQSLSIRGQTNGTYYKALSASFTEPWLGGRKPNSLTVSFYHTVRSVDQRLYDVERFMKVTGGSVGLGQRLEWPDTYFLLNNSVSFEHYNLREYSSYFFIDNGRSNNLSFTTVFSRNSISQPIYPRSGSLVSLSLQITPPYSLFKDKDFWKLSESEKDEIRTDIADEAAADYEIEKRQNAKRYKWIEYHKWKFKSSNFTSIIGKLVLNTNLEFGYLGYFSNSIGPSPFESFQLGGDGLSGYNLYGTETIGLRGYANQGLSGQYGSLTPQQGGNLYEKLTFELRYPLSLNPNATFYALTFFEAGNAWYDFNEFSPFDLKRSVGVGLRIYLSMFGMLGIDYGYGFDDIPNLPDANKGQFAFSIGQRF